jgi:hypothetical protein
MAVATPAAGARETVRQKRERDQELLVWPDLVFVEFICALLFTISFVVLSTLVDAPLLNKANADITPNPSKAPWYFMNLQELLLHMDPGLAGVIVPTLLLIGLMVIPYIDRNNEGQGSWFGTANAVKITGFAFAWAAVWIVWLVLWDDGAHVRVYERLPYAIPGTQAGDDRLEWPANKGEMWFEGNPAGDTARVVWDFVFLQNRVALRDSWSWSMPVPFQAGEGDHDGSLDWPEDLQNVPLPFNGTWVAEWEDPAETWMPGWMRRVYPYDGHLDIPAITAEYVLPIIAMTLLPGLMIFILFRLGWAHNTRDVMISLFTGFIVVYFALTIIGVAFRGNGQQLVPFWRVPNLESNPAIQRYTPPPESPYVLIDHRPGTESHA